MKRIFGRTLRKIIESILIASTVVVNILLLTLEKNDLSVLERAMTIVAYPGEFILCMFVLVQTLVAVASILLTFIKNRKTYLIGLIFSLITTVAFIVFGNIFSIYGKEANAPLTINCIVIAIAVIYYILCLIINPDSFKNENIDEGDKEIVVKKHSKVFVLICSIICIASTLISLLIPLYSYESAGEVFSITPFTVIKDAKSADLVTYIAFIILFTINLINIGFFLSSLTYFKNENGIYVKKSKDFINLNFAYSVAYFLTGLSVTFFISRDGITDVHTVSYIPFLIMCVAMFLFGVASVELPIGDSKKTEKKFPKVEMLLYTILFTALPVLSFFVNLINVTVDGTNELSLTAYQIVRDHGSLSESYQLAAFFLIVLCVVALSLFAFSLSTFFRNKNLFYKFSMVTILVDMLVVFATGTFGAYYQIVQKMNEEKLTELFSFYGLTYTSPNYVITSETMYVFFGAVALLIFVLIRNPIKDIPQGEFKINAINDGLIVPEETKEKKNEVVSDKNNEKVPFEEESNNTTLDACPAFSELDNKASDYDSELCERMSKEFANPTLPSLTDFVVDYARESRLHLSYSKEDIATFIAGLGATRLSILQGMSGTGKTSLPKIFLEAIMGNCDIVEVESSWRDKNELLGYYNEFSKTYTPKKFTQALYKARLNETVPTFIVLDEMNLSRIEYYFSDFLSLMENEEGKREIKLLNVKLYNTYDNEKHSYKALSDDHTIKVPSNVWFIGTANRDESTFEISDKVYDRAHTMNFNKRAPKALYTGEVVEKRFLPYESFNALVKNAQEYYEFNIDDSEVVKAVEKILAPYNISFGNRISNQIEAFVKIYCSCFENPREKEAEAIEKILLSKVVMKLENKSVENKEILISEFNKLKLTKCAEFVSNLNEG